MRSFPTRKINGLNLKNTYQQFTEFWANVPQKGTKTSSKVQLKLLPGSTRLINSLPLTIHSTDSSPIKIHSTSLRRYLKSHPPHNFSSHHKTTISCSPLFT